MPTFRKTQSIVVRFLLLLAFIVSIPNQADAQPLPDVALLGTDVLSWIYDVKAKLDATGRFNSVTGISVNLTTPTLAELQAYDAVLVWSNYGYTDPVTLGNNLADFHDAGGGIVTAMFERHTGSSGKLQGRWDTETYNVFEGGSNLSSPQRTLGTVLIPAHPVMAGVTTFDGGSSSYRPDNTNLTSGSVLIAEWSDGIPLVAIKCINDYPRIDLGFFPPSSDVAASFWQSSTDGALLMANALNYVANPPDGDGDGISDTCDTPSVHNRTQVTDHFTIQAAIEASVNGDMIEADPGTYNEAINFTGKAITLRSASGDPNDTIIDGNGALHVIQCVGGEGSRTVLSGFTITGGNANGSIPNSTGGGMYNSYSSPTVTNCSFSGNTATFGGSGMFNQNSNPVVTHCSFSGNTATFGGGGMYNANSNPTVTHCSFSSNTATDGSGMYNSGSSPKVTYCSFSGNTATFGGGMFNNHSNPIVINCSFSGNTAGFGGGMNNSTSSPTVTNCSFSGNTAINSGGGMYNSDSSPTVTNCILWGDSPDEIINIVGSTLAISFSDVEGGLPLGTIDSGGNIDADPLFVDAAGPDSIAGTEDDNLRLQSDSPCIDAADSTPLPAENIGFDIDGNLRFVNLILISDTGTGPYPYLDMGAYETQFDCNLPGDINCDGVVNLLDLALLAGNWLKTTDDF